VSAAHVAAQKELPSAYVMQLAEFAHGAVAVQAAVQYPSAQTFPELELCSTVHSADAQSALN
jgi:hypothetical protein